MPTNFHRLILEYAASRVVTGDDFRPWIGSRDWATFDGLSGPGETVAEFRIIEVNFRGRVTVFIPAINDHRTFDADELAIRMEDA
jgi:hypothetical protein